MEEKINRDLLLMVFKIKKHPNAILERKSLTSLNNFINGFVWGYNYPHVFTAFPGFQNYISKKYSCKLVLSWVNILIIHANNNEEQTFDLFFEELETFLKDKNIEVPK